MDGFAATGRVVGFSPSLIPAIRTFSMLGDSQSDGYTRRNLLLPMMISILSNGKYVQWSNMLSTSAGGATVNDLFNSTKAAHLTNACAPKSGEIVIFQSGTNGQPVSTWVASDLAAYRQQVKTAVGFLQMAKKFVVMLGIPCKSSVADSVTLETNEARRAVAIECGIPFVDLYSILGTDDSLITVDGTHLNANGVFLVARAIVDVLNNYFQSGSSIPFGGGVPYPINGTDRGVIMATQFPNTGAFTTGSGAGTTGTKSLVTEAGINGNIAQVDWTSTTGNFGDFSVGAVFSVAGGGTQWAVGDVLLMSMKVRLKDFVGASVRAFPWMRAWGGSAGDIRFDMISPNNWHQPGNDTGWLNVVGLSKPAGSPTRVESYVRIEGDTSGPVTPYTYSGTVMIAEPMILNLSQLGLGSLFT